MVSYRKRQRKIQEKRHRECRGNDRERERRERRWPGHCERQSDTEKERKYIDEQTLICYTAWAFLISCVLWSLIILFELSPPCCQDQTSQSSLSNEYSSQVQILGIRPSNCRFPSLGLQFWAILKWRGMQWNATLPISLTHTTSHLTSPNSHPYLSLTPLCIPPTPAIHKAVATYQINSW